MNSNWLKEISMLENPKEWSVCVCVVYVHKKTHLTWGFNLVTKSSDLELSSFLESEQLARRHTIKGFYL